MTRGRRSREDEPQKGEEREAEPNEHHATQSFQVLIRLRSANRAKVLQRRRGGDRNNLAGLRSHLQTSRNRIRHRLVLRGHCSDVAVEVDDPHESTNGVRDARKHFDQPQSASRNVTCGDWQVLLAVQLVGSISLGDKLRGNLARQVRGHFELELGFKRNASLLRRLKR
jgi:hypothetical protein